MDAPDEDEERPADVVEGSTRIALVLFGLATLVALATVGYGIAFH